MSSGMSGGFGGGSYGNQGGLSNNYSAARLNDGGNSLGSKPNVLGGRGNSFNKNTAS